MLKANSESAVIGRGVYGAPEALQLLNFSRDPKAAAPRVSRQTVSRWLRGYDYEKGGEARHSEPLWVPDYANNDDILEISFRDLIELRFVKAFRELGLPLPAIRECFQRAVEEVQDPRPFSTSKFKTDGKTIFLHITDRTSEGQLIDLRRRQGVFRSIVEPSLHDLEFNAEVVARWFPLGHRRRSIVVDPTRAFGRPIAADTGVPTEVLATALKVEGSADKVARLYQVTPAVVRDASDFQRRLAA